MRHGRPLRREALIVGPDGLLLRHVGRAEGEGLLLWDLRAPVGPELLDEGGGLGGGVQRADEGVVQRELRPERPAHDRRQLALRDGAIEVLLHPCLLQKANTLAL